MTSASDVALEVARNFAPPEPVPAVSYRSRGRVLVVGEDARATKVIAELSEMAPVAVAKLDGLQGWLGAFEARWLGGVGQYDLVLDLGERPWFTMHQPPQGYFAPRDDATLKQALAEIADAVGEFEKPKFFLYQEKACAHSRAKLQGCDRCIDVCSTEAIKADGNGVRVEPHLCMGCGACASACPSGAMRYNYPSMTYWGGKMKAVLQAYADAGGNAPCVVLHAETDAVDVSALPRCIPLPVYHVASIGLDWLLGAVALGANQIAVLMRGDEALQYIAVLQEQMALGEAILHGLGYEGEHFLLLNGDEVWRLAELAIAQVPGRPARFNWFDDKRSTLEFTIDHLRQHAPQTAEQVPLPEGAPFGAVVVDGEKCTLCYSCVSVCPAGALLDGVGQPRLNFIERNCVQCGLCENGCPEGAIELIPRLLLSPQANQKKVLHSDTPFECVRCGKVFGTRSMVLGMVNRLSGHSMFASPESLNRLKMCGDCRVVDMMVAQ